MRVARLTNADRSDVAIGTRVAREEIFGPVVVVIGFDDEGEAVRLANDFRYGLGAPIWPRDVARAHRVADTRAVTVRDASDNVDWYGGGFQERLN